MTVKELIEALQEVDDDVMDYQVMCVNSVQLGKNVRLSVRATITSVSENFDVSGEKLILRTEKTEVD